MLNSTSKIATQKNNPAPQNNVINPEISEVGISKPAVSPKSSASPKDEPIYTRKAEKYYKNPDFNPVVKFTTGDDEQVCYVTGICNENGKVEIKSFSPMFLFLLQITSNNDPSQDVILKYLDSKGKKQTFYLNKDILNVCKFDHLPIAVRLMAAKLVTFKFAQDVADDFAFGFKKGSTEMDIAQGYFNDYQLLSAKLQNAKKQ